MKKFIYGVWLMLAVVIFAACQDDIEQAGSKVNEGLPGKLSLTIKVPSADKVTSSRGIYDYESEVKELALIMFERGGRKEFFDLTGKLTHKAYTNGETEVNTLTETGGRIYTLSEDIEGDELSGEYTLYAIANWSSPFCGLTTADLQAMSEEQLNEKLAANENFAISLSGDERLPMTYKSDEYAVVIEPIAENAAEDAGTTIENISLRRITSHIIFNFQNGTSTAEDAETNVKFTPTSYTVYNLPKNANLICKGKSSEGLNKLVDNKYGNSNTISTTGNSFEFFMLENVQDKSTKEDMTYSDRDKWNADTDGTKKFINAPTSSTYIVVKGEYSSDQNFGEVSYTIHLGNFSGTNYNNSKAGHNNFTVNRNEKHTYTVTITGVKSIITEATTDQEEGGNQPGAEGNISAISEGSNFVLDSHYETIMLKFPLDQRCSRSTITVRTPFDNGEYKIEETTEPGDYDWVHFMAPESTEAFPHYKTAGACDITTLARELSNLYNNVDNDDPHYLLVEENGVNYIYTTAFVDEYFYSEYNGKSVDWPEFVDQDNRVIILNPVANPSLDGNNIYHADYIFQISQRSIKTTYTHDGSINAFGIETWNETGKSQFGTPNSSVTEDTEGIYKLYGYQNTSTLLGTNWSINKTEAGYFTAPATNSEDVHIYSNAGTYYGYQACLTRNRDEDGDGTIDEGELKWYLPALEQYTTIWMGRDKLLGDTQLFSNEKMEKLSNDSNDDYYWNKVNLWTSSSGNYRVYWPAEGASYGEDKGIESGVRCVRNLVSQTGITKEITSNSGNIILVSGASELSMRSTSMTGEYSAGHNERSDDNRLYPAFEIATTDLLITSSSSVVFTIDESECSASGSSGNYNLKLKIVPNDGYSYSCQTNETVELNAGNEYTYNGTNLNIGASWMTVTATNAEGAYVTFAVEFKISSSTLSGINIRQISNGNLSTTIKELTLDDKDETVTFELDGEEISTFTSSVIKNNTSLCAAHYTQDADGADLGQWRVPNQRELMLMAEWGYLSDAVASKKEYASSTFFTKSSELDKTEPFVYMGTFTLDPGTRSYYIRCVRDAQTTTAGSSANYLQGESGSSYGAGNSLF